MLIKAARNWDKSLNATRDIMFTTYENENSKVCKEFDKIFKRRESNRELKEQFSNIIKNQNFPLTASKNKMNKIAQKEEEKKEYIIPTSYKSIINGTSRLIRISKKQIIRIVRRKNEKDNINRVDSVCIDNELREQFFADCKQTQYFKNMKKYEIMNTEKDKDIYNKWDFIMDEVYKGGIK